MTVQTIAIHWFRRDLRVQDNLALHAAIASDARVIPLFIFDSALLRSPNRSGARISFLLKALSSLDNELKQIGSHLIVRQGNPLDIITDIITNTGASALYFNKDYTPFAGKRDEHVKQKLTIPLFTYDDALLIPPDDLFKNNGEPFKVFTPFMKQWNTRPKLIISQTRPRDLYTPIHLETGGIPTLAELGFGETIPVPEASENAAINLLRGFMAHDVYTYHVDRNLLVIDPFADKRPLGSSFLSPYLRFGLLSPRQVYWSARAAYEAAKDVPSRESVATFVSELAWREFYMHILYHFPHVAHHTFKRQYDAVEWRDASVELQSWKDGQTGYPIVDAAMRQLQAIGWIPNRARMIVASFLTKDLLIHWREGESHFMQWLIDGDPAANNGGWQWSAGTGTDAQPYFRIFNPVSQSHKFDPTGAYIRHWIPELRHLNNKDIHAPWDMGHPPESYPAPIVQHDFARERALAAFRVVKAGDS